MSTFIPPCLSITLPRYAKVATFCNHSPSTVTGFSLKVLVLMTFDVRFYVTTCPVGLLCICSWFMWKKGEVIGEVWILQLWPKGPLNSILCYRGGGPSKCSLLQEQTVKVISQASLLNACRDNEAMWKLASVWPLCMTFPHISKIPYEWL